MNKGAEGREKIALLETRDLILSEYEILRDTLQQAIKTNTLEKETFQNSFLFLEEAFHKFSILVKNLEAPETIPELPSVKKEVKDCYENFRKLEETFEQALKKKEAAKDIDPIEADDRRDEVSDEQVPEETENKDKEKKRKKAPKKQAARRTIRPPAKPAPSKKLPQDKNKSTQQKSDHFYQLKRITKNLGNGVYATVQNSAYQAARRTDNDVIQAALNTQYYIKAGKAALGMAAGIVRTPTAKLKSDSRKSLTRRELAQYNASANRTHRDLQLKIQKLEQKQKSQGFKRLPKKEQNALEAELKELKQQLPALSHSAKQLQRIKDFQHSRDLDRQILDGFLQNGKIPRNSKALNELGIRQLRHKEHELVQKYGNGVLRKSEKSIQFEINQHLNTSHALRSQRELLERRGKFLSPAERRQLARLKQENKLLGNSIRELKNQQRAVKDHIYIQKQVGRVLKRVNQQRKNISITTGYVRNSVLRPLYDEDNNTTVLAHELSVATDPRLLKGSVKLGKAAVRAPYRALKKAAPKALTRYQYRRQKAKQAKQKVRAAANTAKKKEALRKAAESGGKAAGKASAKSGKAVKETVKAASTVKKAVVHATKTVTAAVKSVSAKYILNGAAIILLIVLLFEIVAIIADLGNTVIFSPHEGENGKIDLGPFVTVIDQEKRRFSAQRDGLEQQFYDEVEANTAAFLGRYQNPPKSQLVGSETYEDTYSKINVSFDGPSSNDRELIAMMAVRFQQDLEDPEAMEYLRQLASQSRRLLTVSDHRFRHTPGCVQVKMQVSEEKPKPKPGGGSHVVPGIKSISPSERSSHVEVPTDPSEPEYEYKWVCPGHRELSIHIHVLTLSELCAADSYTGGPADWEGWTEENIAWAEAFLEMDWAELYTGFHPNGSISVNSSIPPEVERHIWESLQSMTGNPYAAAGIMGNLHCESRLLSNNLEDQYEGILGYSDTSYTSAVDNGSYLNFSEDSAGYGICQWTFSTRKEGLLNLAQGRGVSISDLDMQLNYLEKEFEDFGMMGSLNAMSSVEEASDYILFNFERPANASSLQPTRAGISSYFYNKYMLGTAAEGDLTQAQMDVIQIATNSEAYGIPARAGYCQAWAAYVYGKAGFPIDGSSCARVSGERYGVSSDFTIVPPGAAVYGYSSSKYGHVGIYIGGGLVYHNIGGVAVDNLADWVQRYNGFCWGWMAGTDLTAQP